MSSLLHGAVSLVKLSAQESQAVQRVLEDITIEQDGTTITAKFEAQTVDVGAAVAELRDRAVQWLYGEPEETNE